MKQILFVLILLFFHNLAYNQKASDTLDSKFKDFKEELLLDENPIFPGCKYKKTIVAQKKWMSHKVSRFISRKYKVNIFDDLNSPKGKYHVLIMFKINKSGDVIEAKAKGPHPSLEEEAIKVINLLPRVIRGNIQGNAVIIPFSFPIYLSTN